MEDTENTHPPSKKRAAGRQLSRDNPGLDDEEEGSEQEAGTFKKASDEVLAARRIVRVRRQTPSATPSAPSSNPFAGINLVASPHPPVESSEKTVSEEKSDSNKEIGSENAENKKETENKIEAEVNKPEHKEIGNENDENNKQTENKTEAEVDKTENEEEKKEAEGEKSENNNENENTKSSAEPTPFSSFGQLSSTQNAFTGITGTGFSSSTFSFGSISKDGSDSAPQFGLKTESPNFSFGLSHNGNSSSLFVNKSEGIGFPSMAEVPVETGEENEEAVFSADSVLFEFLDGGWKERGKGELKLNVSKTGDGKSRLIMRAKGNFRLILNASLYPDMKLTSMDKKGITFACVNSAGEGKEGLSTVALKFKDVSIVEEFREVVTKYKKKTETALKTPENSPKATEE